MIGLLRINASHNLWGRIVLHARTEDIIVLEDVFDRAGNQVECKLTDHNGTHGARQGFCDLAFIHKRQHIRTPDPEYTVDCIHPDQLFGRCSQSFCQCVCKSSRGFFLFLFTKQAHRNFTSVLFNLQPVRRSQTGQCHPYSKRTG